MRLTTLILTVIFTARVWALPDTALRIIPGQTALVVTDPQSDLLAEGWAVAAMAQPAESRAAIQRIQP